MKPHLYKTTAFSLVEVTLALGVCAFSLLAIFGLLPIALQSNQAAVEQTAANSILSAVSADLRSTPSTSGTSQQFNITIPSNPVTASSTQTLYFTSSGQSSPSLNASSSYLLTVNFLSSTNSITASCANLQVTWPAAAATTSVAGSAKTFVALDRN